VAIFVHFWAAQWVKSGAKSQKNQIVLKNINAKKIPNLFLISKFQILFFENSNPKKSSKF
jgi:hypothetical protein